MVGLIKQKLPWWLKIGAKLLLARAPLPYSFWRSLDLFKHGSMQEPEYALSVFLRHYERAKPYLSSPFTVLEFGPGDSLATALLAATYGASKVYLVDAAPFATMEVEQYNRLSRVLLDRTPSGARPVAYGSVPEMLEATHTVYLTSGLDSLRTIPDASVDFVFSQAVIEHVALREVAAIMCELYRVQKPGGIASHRVDLQDHLAHGLNSLRFSHALWESKLFASSGFYTNRLRASQLVTILTAAGYEVIEREDERWRTVPLERSKLHREFAELADDDLRISGLDILLGKEP